MSVYSDKPQNFIFVAVVNVFVIAVLVECLSVSYFFFANDVFYYTQTLESPAEHTTKTNISADRTATQLVIHPVLGVSQRPGIAVNEKVSTKRLKGLIDDKNLDEVASLTANNLGFFSAYDYPYSTKDNDYVVGVFGGSVAQWFALQAREYFVYLLKDEFPALADKDIVILNMAQGGYKQPQQLILLNYLLALGQNFDLIVNIDGFNEVALAKNNQNKNVHEGFPSAYALLSLVELSDSQSISQEQFLLLARSLTLKNKLKNLEIDIQKSSFSSAALFRTLYSYYIDHQYQQVAYELNYLQTNRNEESIIYIQPADSHTGRPNLMLWQRSVAQMQALSRQLDISFLSILQANQYYTNHIFSEKEALIALSPRSPYRQVISSNYPDLELLVGEMKEQGIHIESAVSIFDQEARAVYVDSCCHYNPLGNEILAAFIVEEIDFKLPD